MERRTYFFTGRVQGVGFRAAAHYVAKRFPVTGTVRNLDDGRVEMVIEGLPANIETVLEGIHASLGRHIREIQYTVAPATGEFPGFMIAR